MYFLFVKIIQYILLSMLHFMVETYTKTSYFESSTSLTNKYICNEFYRLIYKHHYYYITRIRFIINSVSNGIIYYKHYFRLFQYIY